MNLNSNDFPEESFADDPDAVELFDNEADDVSLGQGCKDRFFSPNLNGFFPSWAESICWFISLIWAQSWSQDSDWNGFFPSWTEFMLCCPVFLILGEPTPVIWIDFTSFLTLSMKHSFCLSAFNLGSSLSVLSGSIDPWPSPRYSLASCQAAFDSGFFPKRDKTPCIRSGLTSFVTLFLKFLYRLLFPNFLALLSGPAERFWSYRD